MATASHPNRGTEDQFELVIRLQQSRTSHPAEAGLEGSSAHALVRDILKARLQVDAQADGEHYLHASGFSDLGKALAAGRALQVAFEGLRSAAPVARPSISLVLDAPGPGETPTGASVDQKDLLSLAKPSQVLITQALYNRIALAQPVALRSFPACAGIYEFLWTSTERLDELRLEGEFMPTLVVDPAPQMATFEETVISYPAPRFSEPVSGDMVRPAAIEAPVAPAYEGEKKPPRRVGLMLGLGALAAVLFAGGLAAWQYLQRSAIVPRKTVGASTTVTPSPTAPYTPPPVEPGPAPPKMTPTPQTAESSAMHPPLGTPKVVSPPKPPITAPVARSSKCTIEGSDIPQYLDLANKYRNSGRYDDAERVYSTILGCQPGNRVARDGLARLHGR